MKKVFFATVLMLVALFVSSCNKVPGLKEQIPGSWKITAIDFAYDGARLNVDIDRNYLITLDEDRLTHTYYWMPEGKSTVFGYSIEFKEDGTASLQGKTIIEWSVDGEKLNIVPVGVGPFDGINAKTDFIDGKIILSVDNVALAYAITTDARTPMEMETDGKKHTLTQTITLEKK